MPLDGFNRSWRHALRRPATLIRTIALTSALLAVVLVGPALEHLGWGRIATSSGNAVAGARKFLLDPLLYLNRRSPGARGPGELLQTKNRAAQTGRKTGKPHERVLANVRYAPSGLTPPQFLSDLIVPAIAPFEISPPVIPQIRGPFPLPGFPIVPLVPIGPGGGGGGGGGGGKPPVAVPEPATWSMLILGMVLMGAGLRSMHRRRAKSETRDNALKRDAVPCDRLL